MKLHKIECARGRQRSGIRGVQQQRRPAARQHGAAGAAPAAARAAAPRRATQARRHASAVGRRGRRRPADPQGRAAGGRPGQRGAASAATPSSSSRSTTPSTASTTSSRARRTCRRSWLTPAVDRRRRPVQLGRREGPDPDQQLGRPAPVQPREYQRDADQAGVRRAGLPQDQPGQDQLHPRRGHGRHPGPGDGHLRLQHARPQEHARSSTT